MHYPTTQFCVLCDILYILYHVECVLLLIRFYANLNVYMTDSDTLNTSISN